MLAELEALQIAHPLTTSGEWQTMMPPGPTTGQQGVVKSAGLTTEMGPAEGSLLSEASNTLIEGLPTPHARTPDGSLPVQDAAIYAYLDYEKDGEMARRLPITEKYVIVGRLDPKRGITPEIDLTTLDPQATVSRQHARIRFEKTFFYIEDLKSRNRTRLGELVLTPLKPELIQHGDIVCFGSLKMVFRVPGMHTQPTPQNLP
jgi:hypothetical protein